MFVHRQHYYAKKAIPVRKTGETMPDFQQRLTEWQQLCADLKGQGIVIVEKNRNGPTGVAKVSYQDETTWFRDGREAPHSPAWVFQEKTK
jgi:replicative DNA helicase